MKRLNLGCGTDVKKGYVNVDFVKLKGVDIAHDLNKVPYPFRNNEFEEVYVSHVLEHLDDITKTMKELKRIVKPKGRLFIRVPHFSCGVNYRDPTHKRLFSYFTFDYFTKECFYGLPEFKIIRRKLNFTRLSFTSLNYFFNSLINFKPAIYERFFCWILPASEVLCELEVVK
jgi:ubiquinone/menaquinone biosynthesis C-methylase UbiE